MQPSNDLLHLLTTVPQYIAIVAAVLTAFVALLGTFRSGALKRVRIGSFELEGIERETAKRIQTELATSEPGAQIPFEIEQLASYYAVTLGQAKISFWFSLVFASVGFTVIVGAAFIANSGDIFGASLKILSGVIIDAVAALFFVQSRRAQEAMGTFFEKLRTDRQYIEGRKMCEELTDDGIKNNLKAILVLHYSGLQSGGMLDLLAGVEPKRAAEHTERPQGIKAKTIKANPGGKITPPNELLQDS